jgi:hypothetical protein
MKEIGLFGAATLLVFIVAATVSIFGFDQYEHAWGRWGSFQVEAWISLVGTLVAMGSFGIGLALLRRVPTHGTSFSLGGICGVAYIFLCWIMSGAFPSAGPFTAFLLLIAVSVIPYSCWAPQRQLTIRSNGPLRRAAVS